MYVYHYRLFDRYDRSIASLAILGDESPTWRPQEYQEELWGCRLRFNFPIVKLLDYQNQWTELETSSNPFATVVMAHLKAKETKQNSQNRQQWKLYLTKRLYQKGYQREDIIKLFKFIDWVITLPSDLDQLFWQEIDEYEEANKMPYITSVERIGMRRGLRQGLLSGIELGLELKFGEEGLQLLAEISQIDDVDKLKAIQKMLYTATTIQEIRQIYQ